MNPNKDIEKQKKTILIFVVLSLLLHLLVGLFFLWMPKNENALNAQKPESQVVWVKPQTEIPQQIADIEKPLQEKRPDKAKYAGQYDSSVKEEQVAKPKPKPKVIKENPLSGEGPSQPKRLAQKPSPKTTPAEKAPQKTAQKSPPKKQMQPPEKSEIEKAEPKEYDLALKPEDVLPKEVRPRQESHQPSSPSPALEYGKGGAPDLFSHDYFPDYKVGGKTYLNVMNLQDVGYFVKLKRILKMRWNPIPPVREYVMSGHISAGKIECVVGVALDSTGNIAEMIMIRSSGIGGYDQEVLQTFRDSSPFSSPPTAYLKDGQLRMSWTFTVYL